MLDISWHLGSPSQRKRGKSQPRFNLPQNAYVSSSSLSNESRTPPVLSAGVTFTLQICRPRITMPSGAVVAWRRTEEDK
jgi:hypothetical protein